MLDTPTESFYPTHDIMDIIRSEILSREFGSITGYEPDPKREEWRGPEDCPPCPYFCRVQYEDWGMICWATGEPFNACRLGSSMNLGHPSFCRFAKYRRILFRRFELWGMCQYRGDK